MFSIKINDNLITRDNLNNSYNINNCIFSTNESRPSKSLIDCNKYKDYSKLNLNIDILNEFSYINSQTKTLNSLLLRELISVFKFEESISLSFDTIIINEGNGGNGENEENFNLLFCLEKTPTIKNIFENLQQLFEEMNNGDNLIINFVNLFTYPSAELLIIILNMFQKVKIYYCKIIKQNVLYCQNFTTNSHEIKEFIDNVLSKWKFNVRQFGIFINSSVLDLIKTHNTYIFDYYLNLNDNIADSTMEDKEFFFKHYCKKYSKNNPNAFECGHSLKDYNLEKCYICIKCYELFSVY